MGSFPATLPLVFEKGYGVVEKRRGMENKTVVEVCSMGIKKKRIGRINAV